MARKEIPQSSTAIKRAAFLKAYAEVGIIAEACRIVGIDRKTYYNWQSDVLFQAQCEQARIEAVENLEAIARKRAAESSDTLLIFLLKGAAPDKYRDRSTLTHEFRDLSDDELLARAKGVIGGGSKAGAQP